VREQEAIPGALGISRAQFCDDFMVWAEGELRSWGLLPDPLTPTLEELEDELRWADPQLAEVMVASQQARLDAITKALADPFPHKKLAQIWLDSDTPARAIPHLGHIDQHEQKSPVFALELAKLLRRSGRQADALEKATRAAQISPYEPSIRVPAAEIAIEAGRLDLARRHIAALTVLEPDHQRHRQRLEAIDRMIAQGR
jgi:predicted Zn-dependent protease